MSTGHQRTRQLLSILSLTLFALALPAQGLGNLVDEVVDGLPELPVTTTISIPTTIPVPTIPGPTTIPVTTLPEVTIPDLPIDEVVPPPVTTTVPIALGDAPVGSAPIVTSPTTTDAVAQVTSVTSIPALDVQAATGSGTQPSATDRPIEIELLDAIDASPSVALVTPSTTWLASITDWLSIESVGEVLAIPFRLLNVLFRALMSAGSGLVAPASLLLTLGVGARGRLRPAAA